MNLENTVYYKNIVLHFVSQPPSCSLSPRPHTVVSSTQEVVFLGPVCLFAT